MMKVYKDAGFYGFVAKWDVKEPKLLFLYINADGDI